MVKPWNTSAWKKRREEILNTRNKCEWCGSTKILVMDHITPPNVLTEEHYLAIRDEDIIVLCRRCAGARLHGLRLCPTCKVRYRKLRYPTCFECYSKTEKGKKWLELRADSQCEEEVPLVDFVLPCEESVRVYEDQLRYGGTLEVCMHQCPNPDVRGDVNSCAPFLQMIKEEEEEIRRLSTDGRAMDI